MDLKVVLRVPWPPRGGPIFYPRATYTVSAPISRTATDNIAKFSSLEERISVSVLWQRRSGMSFCFCHNASRCGNALSIGVSASNRPVAALSNLSSSLEINVGDGVHGCNSLVVILQKIVSRWR